MRKFFDTVDDYWWIGLPAAIGLSLAHFVNFTSDWATILYWSLFGFMVFNILAALVIGLLNRNTTRKDLVRPGFWYPWPYVIFICTTYVWMPNSSIVKGPMVCYLGFIVGLWVREWKYYLRSLSIPKGTVPGRGR